MLISSRKVVTHQGKGTRWFDRQTMHWLGWGRKPSFSFIFFWVEGRTERSSTPFHLRPSCHLLFSSFMLRESESPKTIAKGLGLTDQSKAAPSLLVFRDCELKPPGRKPARTAWQGGGQYSVLSRLWWQGSSRDKRAPPSWVKLKRETFH